MTALRQFILLCCLLALSVQCYASPPQILAQQLAVQVPKGIRIYEAGAAKNFILKNLDGDSIELAQLRGRWVFLHFWASWCGPCRKEMPTINQLASKLDADEISILMVNTAENEDTIFSFLGEISMDLPVYMDRSGEVTEVWKPRGLPTSFLIDPAGQVRYQAIGGREWGSAEYLDFLAQLIATKP